MPCGVETKESFLSKERHLYPNPSFKVIDYINKHVKRDARVLFMGETRGYYCQRRHVTNSVFDVPLIVKWTRKVNSDEGLYNLIRREGITHILFNPAEVKRLESFKMYDWDKKEFSVFISFWNKYLKRIFNYNNVVLYEIL